MTQQNQLYNALVADLESGKLILPTLPDVALKVRQVVEDPEASARQLADIIATDAALSTRLLKVANSALYRGRLPVESVQAAVSRLGLTLIRNLVTSLMLQQLFNTKNPALEQKMREAWQHSTQVAAISQVIAARQPRIPTDEAMLAGLIHAIGVLPVLTKLAEMAPTSLQNEQVLEPLLEELHPKIGTLILQRWHFPENLIAVPAEYQNLLRHTGSDKADLVDIVQVAHLQSDKGSAKALSPKALENAFSFKKLGLDIGISVAELDENSEEYAEALAMFSQF